jgi:hypothetical protein
MILFEFTSKAFESQALVSKAVISDAAMESCDQIAIEVAPYLWRNLKARGDCDHNFFKSLGCSWAIV